MVAPNGTVITENDVLSDAGFFSRYTALNFAGSVLWQTDFASEDPYNQASALAADGTSYFWDYSNGIVALSSIGSVKWTETKAVGQMAIGGDGTLYVATGTELAALDPVNGKVVWTCPCVGTNPIIGSDGTIYLVGGGDVFAIH